MSSGPDPLIPGPVPEASARTVGGGAGQPIAQPGDVIRTSLLARLVRLPPRGVALIVGPAGSGKTTLASQFSETVPRSVWVRLRPIHDGPAPFALELASAIARARPDLEPEVLAGSAEPGTAMHRHAILDALVDASEPLVVVIDDLHVIEDRAVIGWLDDLVGDLPPTVRLVISSRRVPDLRLARLRLANRLVVIDDALLRLGAEEVREMVAATPGAGSAVDPDSILEVSGGWAAGAVLAVLDAAAGGAPGALPHSGAVEYLLEEVLAELPSSLLRFLAATAVVDSFDLALATALSGETNPEALVDDLVRRRLFVSTDGTQWWYHDLFREAVLSQSGVNDDCRRRALEVFEHDGDVARALQQATALRDVDAIWRLVLSPVDDELAQLLVGRLAGTYLAQEWFHGRLPLLGPAVRTAFAAGPATDEAAVAAGALVLQLAGDCDLMMGMVQRHLTEHPTPDVTFDRIGLRGLLGIGFLVHGGVDQAVEAGIRARDAGVEFFAGTVLDQALRSPLAEALACAGRITEAQHEADQALALSDELGIPANRTIVFSTLGFLALLRGDLVQAQACLDEVLALSDRQPPPFERTYGPLLAAVLAASAGDREGALVGLEHAVTSPEFRATWFTSAPTFAVLATLREHAWDHAGAESARRAAAALAASDRCGRMATIIEDIEDLVRTDSRSVVASVGLSDREAHVLRLLKGRQTLREIGSELYVSVNTVKTHTASIYRKLGVSSRDELRRVG